MSSEKTADEKYLQSPLLKLYFYIRDMNYNSEKYKIGKILTIIDSVIVDEKQNKAVKDLIHGVYTEKTYHRKNLEELLGQFADKYCPDVENDCDGKIERRSKHSIEAFKFN